MIGSPPARPTSKLPEVERRAGDVLRYWLGLLEYEEALAARPRARRPVDAPPGPVDLREPVGGQDYAKLPFAGAEGFLVERSGEIALDLSAEWGAFFEDWLALRYRRGPDDDAGASHFVLFPAIHLPREELAGVLRFPVEVEWRLGDRPFLPSGPADRASQSAPTGVVLRQPPEVEDGDTLPFFVDARLLRDTLRVDEERLDEFFGSLRGSGASDPRRVVESVARLIEDQIRLESPAPDPREEEACASLSAPGEPTDAPVPAGPEVLLARLGRAVRLRLGSLSSRARAYPVALVVRTAGARTTWHLQRDLKSAMEHVEAGDLRDTEALCAYLTGSPVEAAPSPCFGRWPAATLTASQEGAVEIALGSKLAAIQGPPGTGKTTLILNLLAHTLVEKVAVLARGERMGQSITVVVSTNNRAVDNVVDPLGRDLDERALPLALRVGSRQVMEHVTLRELDRVRRWLESETLSDLEAPSRLRTELEQFQDRRRALEKELLPAQQRGERSARRSRLERDLGELARTTREGGGARLRAMLLALEAGKPPAASPSRASSRAVDAFLARSAPRSLMLIPLRTLCARLEALSELAEGTGAKALSAVCRHWRETERKHLARLSDALGFAVVLNLPPAGEPTPVEGALEAWEQGAEWALGALRAVEEAVAGESRIEAEKARMAEAQAELARLSGDEDDSVAPLGPEQRAELDRRHVELFECAVRVREAWASVHRHELVRSVGDVAKTLRASRSLRGLFTKRDESVRWLRELFPAWGCTLLSLGNVFPADPDAIPIAVLDEAGQCHPAYAVAALLRARRACLLGDVHQLEPVVGLGTDDERRIVKSLRLEGAVEQLAGLRVYDGSGVSAQSLADRAVAVRPTLVDHFRCQPAIARVSEALCGYGLVVRTRPKTRADIAPLLEAPLLYLDVDGAQERFAGSWVNRSELDATVELARELLASGLSPDEVAVITPYRGQLEQLWRRFRELGLAASRPPSDLVEPDASELLDARERGIAVGTVHRFQGGERSVVLFTTTITDPRSLSFLNARVNLVNVAASRAREHLVTIGHIPTLRAGRYTRFLLEGAAALRARLS